MIYNKKILIVGGGRLKKICIKKYDYIILVNKVVFDTGDIPTINIVNSNEKIFIKNNNLKIIVNNIEIITLKQLIINIINKYFKKYSQNNINYNEINRIKKKLNIKNSYLPPFIKLPSTGIIAIIYFYEKNNKIDLMGFDRLVSDNSKDYYVNYESNGLIDTFLHTTHDFDIENKFIIKLIKNNEIINIGFENNAGTKLTESYYISFLNIFKLLFIYIYFYKIRILKYIFYINLLPIVIILIIGLFIEVALVFTYFKNLTKYTLFPLNLLINDTNLNKYVFTIFIFQNLYLLL